MYDLTTFASQVWLMDPDRLHALANRLAAVREWPTPLQVEEARQLAAQRMRRVAGKVGVIRVHGMIEQRMGPMGALFGGFATEDGEAALDAMLEMPDVSTILLDVDSPGGTSAGIEEFAERLFEARGQKRIYAVANSYAASAAYWLASAADKVVVSPGGEVGSVGVFAVHQDVSGLLEKVGIKATVVRAGKHKAEFIPFEPLRQEAKDYLQDQVNATYGKFLKALARNRGVSVQTVRDKYGQGRMLNAEQAVDTGMADRVMTMSQVLNRLTGGEPLEGIRRAAFGTDVLRLRNEQARRQWSGAN